MNIHAVTTPDEMPMETLTLNTAVKMRGEGSAGQGPGRFQKLRARRLCPLYLKYNPQLCNQSAVADSLFLLPYGQLHICTYTVHTN